jgi:hypothetical protein
VGERRFPAGSRAEQGENRKKKGYEEALRQEFFNF